MLNKLLTWCGYPVESRKTIYKEVDLEYISMPAVRKVLEKRIYPGRFPVEHPTQVIAAAPRPAKWWSADIAPSAAEQIIMDIVDKYDVEWYREVSFETLPSARGFYRFDFWFPGLKLIVEYDGQLYHNSYERQLADTTKEQFCSLQGIRVVRYNKRHYYQLSTHIDNLMREFNIRKLVP